MVFKKGQTYEERYGVEMARAIKEKKREFMKLNCPMWNEESRKKSSIAHTGKKLSEQTCKRLSESHKGITPKNINLCIEKGKATRFGKGIIPHNKGKSPSEETRKKIGLKGLWSRHTEEWKAMMRSKRQGKLIWNKGKKETRPEVLEKLRIIRSKIVFPKKDSKIEVKIQNFLEQLGIEYFAHKYIKEIEHGYQCDILIPSMNLVIEADGNYWHKYPIGREIDNIRTSELLEKGFKVLRLWENEIKVMEVEDLQNKLEEMK